MASIKKSIPYLLLILLVLGAVIALIWLDSETNSWNQVLSPGNIASGLLYYALPTLLVVFLVFKKLNKRLNIGVSMAVYVMAGIPITFVWVIFTLKLVSVLT